MKTIFYFIKRHFTNYFPKGTLIKGKGSSLSMCVGRHIKRNEGNIVVIGKNSQLFSCCFLMNGSNNSVKIGNNVLLNGVTFWIKGNNNEIIIGDYTTVGKNTEFAALETTKIIVGEDCMFSHDIQVRTSDSHSILDKEGHRTNPAKDIHIGNHVWVGLEVLFLKGSEVKDNSVIAARSMVTKQFTTECCLIGGAPAKELKSNINWSRDRI